MQADRIRSELFETPRYDKEENAVIGQLMDYMTGEFLNAGISVVYDTNSMRAAQRHALREMARKAHAVPLLVWLQIDAETAFVRGTKRDRRRADDKYAATMDRNMFNSVVGYMQNPVNTEDYVVISGKHAFNTQYSAAAKKMRELGILQPTDSPSGIPKPELVNLIPNPAAGRVDMSRRNIVIR